MTAYNTQDLYTTNHHRADGNFTQFNHPIAARRIVTLLIVLLMLLLVGGCKATPTTTTTLSSVVNPAQELQGVLFPDQAGFHGLHYVPAAAYVSQARNFVENMPQSMLLLSRDQIGYMFGKPSFHRHDADAEVWQYKTAACVVDFYFYGKNQVSYMETRHKDQTPASAREVSSCLHNIDNKAFNNAGI